MKAMGGGLSVSQGDDRWTTIFTILSPPDIPNTHRLRHRPRYPARPGADGARRGHVARLGKAIVSSGS